jgi:hypothetical protein
MALTSNTIHVPETAIPVPHHRLRAALIWAAVVVALGLSVVLLVTALHSSSDADVVPHSGLIERGSITAIDRAGPVPTAAVDGRGSTIAERGTITQLDRAASQGSR